MSSTIMAFARSLWGIVFVGMLVGISNDFSLSALEDVEEGESPSCADVGPACGDVLPEWLLEDLTRDVVAVRATPLWAPPSGERPLEADVGALASKWRLSAERLTLRALFFARSCGWRTSSPSEKLCTRRDELISSFFLCGGRRRRRSSSSSFSPQSEDVRRQAMQRGEVGRQRDDERHVARARGPTRPAFAVQERDELLEPRGRAA